MDWSKQNCPNCNSSAFIETISTESCPDCDTNFSMVDRANLVVGIISMKL